MKQDISVAEIKFAIEWYQEKMGIKCCHGNGRE